MIPITVANTGMYDHIPSLGIRSGLSIGHRHMRGGGPLLQAWPREERPLTVAERYELQQLLGQRGFDVGDPDGRIGPRTRIAIRNFQVATGQTPDGFPSSHVLDRLRQP